ncbi:MAG TPA: TIGR03013 family XrtA/PEP-CTERM system glycosyltransferase [Candidatus Competibacteraceae bacterium]|nr:TIGR03013 family XrtA/PEP-CTERM system glycosyltransferase [Candidatus Competibacteraceae bacterium]
MLLILLETLECALAVYLGVELRFHESSLEARSSIEPLWPKAVLFASFMVAGMGAMGLYYRGFRERPLSLLLRVVVGCSAGLLALTLLFYVMPTLFFGRGVMGLALLLSVLGVFLTHSLFFAMMDQEALKRRVMVLGVGNRANLIETRLRRQSDRRGFTIVGYRDLGGDPLLVDSRKLIRDTLSLPQLVRKYRIDEIVVAVDDRRHVLPMDELMECRMRGVEMTELPMFFERETGRVMLDILSPSWFVFSEGFTYNTVQVLIKRGFDVAVSLLLLAVTWPLMLVTALAIVIESGRPVFYRQLRVGVNGSVFQLLKFRSMRPDAEGDGRARWAAKNDSRVTRVGAVIRKLRIDELPQVFNVLRGDMSFVGPRPERPEFTQELALKIPYYQERHRVKPGITGWAQIRYPYGATVQDAMEKLQYDLYYTKNHSFLLDISVLVQTAEVILFGKGAR